MTDCGKIRLINGNDFEKIEFQYREFTQGVWLNSLQFLSIGYNDCGGIEVFQPLLSSSLSVPLLSLGKTETHHKRVENILLEINLLSTFLRFSHMN